MKESNAIFFANGRYHLMYLYLNAKTKCFSWGHISSRDLVHWRQHLMRSWLHATGDRKTFPCLWRGVFALPRVLWLGEDNTLRMAPLNEYEILRVHPLNWDKVPVKSGTRFPLQGVIGDSCELRLEINKSSATRFGVRVRTSKDGSEYAALYYDAKEKMLCVDTTHGEKVGLPAIEKLPLDWPEGKPLVLRIFVDKVILDFFGDDRQAISRQYFSTNEKNLGVELYSEEGDTEFSSVKAWEISPSNPWKHFIKKWI